MRYLITQSLISAYKYQFTDFYDIYEKEESAWKAEERAQDDFLSILRREDRPTTEAMQNGIDFEELVVKICEGNRIVHDGQYDHPQYEKWLKGACEIAHKVKGSVFQAAISAPLKIGGMEYLLHGRLDALKRGTIYDIKFSSRYEYGKFFDSAQHPMYLALVPEAHTFIYLVYSDGRVYEESYRREDTRDIAPIISEFAEYLNAHGLMEIYKEKWLARD